MCAHMVCDVKHAGHRKARLVADGHLTNVPMDSTLLSVVSLQGLRLVIFMVELNGLQVWGTDIGNTCLEAHTKEKLYVVGGGEFADQEGHALVIDKALYRLKSSSLRWHKRLH